MNQRGLIPGPGEKEVDFFYRCQAAIPLSSTPVSPLATQVFDIAPDWVEIQYKKKGLHFWEGGCTWIEGHQVTLQLNPAFLRREHRMGYSREEMIAHELIHAVRATFSEPIFEEVLAYQTSPRSFRRFFGPVFRSPKETLIYAATLIGYTLSSLLNLFQLPLFLTTLALTTYGLIRLLRTQWIFHRAYKRVSALVDKTRILAVMIRLSDQEIIRFSRMPSQEILSYAQQRAQTDLRWQQILTSYFTAI